MLRSICEIEAGNSPICTCICLMEHCIVSSYDRQMPVSCAEQREKRQPAGCLMQRGDAGMKKSKYNSVWIGMALLLAATAGICTGCSTASKDAAVSKETQTETETETETTAPETETVQTEKKSTAETTAYKSGMYVDMSESYINQTDFGSYTTRSGGYVGSWSHKKHYAYDYYWRDSQDRLLLKVHTYDGKVDYIIQNGVTYDKNSVKKTVYAEDSVPISRPSSSGTSSRGSSTSSRSTANAYDEGYNAVDEDGDYDENRYKTDDDYARGVDDAIDDNEDDW